MASASANNAVVVALYRALYRMASRIDADPALKALVPSLAPERHYDHEREEWCTLYPFSDERRGYTALALLFLGAPLYRPARGKPESLREWLSGKFRVDEASHDRGPQLDAAFAALSELNLLIAAAEGLPRSRLPQPSSRGGRSAVASAVLDAMPGPVGGPSGEQPLLLAAHPMQLSASFGRSLILVTQHGAGGSHGWLVNKPSAIRLRHAARLLGLRVRQKELGHLGRNRVYVGGPVAGPLLALHPHRSLLDADADGEDESYDEEEEGEDDPMLGAMSAHEQRGVARPRGEAAHGTLGHGTLGASLLHPAGPLYASRVSSAPLAPSDPPRLGRSRNLLGTFSEPSRRRLACLRQPARQRARGFARGFQARARSAAPLRLPRPRPPPAPPLPRPCLLPPASCLLPPASCLPHSGERRRVSTGWRSPPPRRQLGLGPRAARRRVRVGRVVRRAARRRRAPLHLPRAAAPPLRRRRAAQRGRACLQLAGDRCAASRLLHARVEQHTPLQQLGGRGWRWRRRSRQGGRRERRRRERRVVVVVARRGR